MSAGDLGAYRRATRSTTRWPRRRGRAGLVNRALLVAIAACLALAPAASADARHRERDHSGRGPHSLGRLALQWYDITDQTVTAAAFPEPVTQSRLWSVAWLAAARAVKHAHNPSYSAAAFAQALHDVLLAQVPAQQAQLDDALATTLAAIPDGAAKNAGITEGKQEAALVLLQRQGDGLDTASLDIPFTPPPPGPGVWQPTPPTFAPAVRAGEGNARPFVLEAADQFDPGPPPSLSSPTYLRSLAEVRAYGSATQYPDWPSGHGGVAGAAQQVLTAFLGPRAPAPISVTSPTDPGSTHVYDNWHQITREVINARVWEGIHFRFSDDVGAHLGRAVAGYDLPRLDSIGL
jgi:hypothetical protein